MSKIEQVGGTHYKQEIQPWDEFKRLNVSWAQGEVTKYLCRWPLKGGIRDLEKALSIIRKYQTSYRKREIRYISYNPVFLEQYRDIYGPMFLTFQTLIRRVLREEWYLAESLIVEIIDYFKRIQER